MDSTSFKYLLTELNSQIELAEYLKCTEMSEELKLRRNNLYAVYLRSPGRLINSKLTGKPDINPIKVAKSRSKDEILKRSAM